MIPTGGRGSDGISRRDFLNGVLLAAGGAAVGSSIPIRALACPDIGRNVPDGRIGRDPQALRGGNLPDAFKVPHWMRDLRLTFSQNTVTLAPSRVDRDRGTFQILPDTGDYEVIIAGTGMSGLSAAFYLRRRRPGTRVLLLDTNCAFGGNAGRDEAPPIPTVAPTGAVYAVAPYDEFLFEIYRETGIDWAAHYVPEPFYNYFFDDRAPYAIRGTRSWVQNVYGDGTRNMPYPPAVLSDLERAKLDFRNWYNRAGSPTEPADNSDPQYDYLSQITLHAYFQSQGYHPAVSDFYTRFTVDALAGTAEQVNAHSSTSFIAAEYHPVFSMPGGNSAIARHVLKWLIPSALDGSATEQLIASALHEDQLDNSNHAVRLRQVATVVRADTTSRDASVIYYHGGNFHRATAKAVILAGQLHTAHHVVAHIQSQAAHEASCEVTLAPVVIANVTLRRAAPLVNLGLGYNQYWWGSRYWADFVTADWVTRNRFDRDRSTVLTFYGANVRPPEEMDRERVKLLTTPFSAYENSLREDLSRVLAAEGFDFDRDVSAVYLYRWGHGMVYPKVGAPFGPPLSKGGQAVRTPAPRHIARQPLGRISFGGQDTEGTPAIEGAIGSGLRTAEEVLAIL